MVERLQNAADLASTERNRPHKYHRQNPVAAMAVERHHVGGSHQHRRLRRG